MSVRADCRAGPSGPTINTLVVWLSCGVAARAAVISSTAESHASSCPNWPSSGPLTAVSPPTAPCSPIEPLAPALGFCALARQVVPWTIYGVTHRIRKPGRGSVFAKRAGPALISSKGGGCNALNKFACLYKFLYTHKRKTVHTQIHA